MRYFLRVGGLRAGRAIMVACPCNTSFFRQYIPPQGHCPVHPPSPPPVCCHGIACVASLGRPTAHGIHLGGILGAWEADRDADQGDVGAQLLWRGGTRGPEGRWREGGREGGVKLRPGPGRVPPEDKEGGFYKRKSKRRASPGWRAHTS